MKENSGDTVGAPPRGAAAISFHHLERYPMSVILSFLTETEGTSLLICQKVWVRSLLRIFRLPPSSSQQQHRHRYIVYPVQDASTRLEQLNTKRWRQKWKRGKCGDKNIIQYYNLSMEDLAAREWKQSMTLAPTENDNSGVENVNRKTTNSTAFAERPPLLQFWSKSLERSLLQSHEGTTASQLYLPGTTVLASYPRSGNTLVRSLLESVTGFVTASDTRADRPLSIALADRHGLVGEGRTHDPICKTHWPERVGCQPYRAARVILLVRNPWDAIDSYWNLNLTNTHTRKVTDQVYQDHQEFFQQLVRNEIAVWLEFLEFYWKQKDVPVLLVRYEDLILNREKEVERMLYFCTTFDWWRPRLQSFGQKHAKQRQHQHGYRSSVSASTSPTSYFGRSLLGQRYSEVFLQELHSLIDILDGYGWLERLGYHVKRQGFPKNITCLPELPLHDTKNHAEGGSASYVSINQPLSKELRPRDSPFGRNMRQWRRQYTDDDRNPFPTV